jgi:hypothetical protein
METETLRRSFAAVRRCFISLFSFYFHETRTIGIKLEKFEGEKLRSAIFCIIAGRLIARSLVR